MYTLIIDNNTCTQDSDCSCEIKLPSCQNMEGCVITFGQYNCFCTDGYHLDVISDTCIGIPFPVTDIIEYTIL